jgi:triphosphatase
MARDREVEWQLDALDLRPVVRWLAARPAGTIALKPGASVLLRDRYLDTEDWRLHRAGATVRIRSTGRRSEATLKSKGTLVDGLRDRRELTEPLPSPDVEALRALPGDVGRTVRSLVGRRKLRQLFEIRTRRKAYTVLVDGEDVGELTLDDTSIPVAGGRPARLQRVEIEVEPDAVDTVADLVGELRAGAGLRPAGASKFQAGLLAAGLTPPAAEDLGSKAVHQEMTVGELAFAVLRTHFATFLDREPGARVGDDPEQVHDMRVATRRMRAAMSLFREALPVRTQRLREEFRWIANALGEVRDLDVQIEQFTAWEQEMEGEDRAAIAPLVARLEERRRDARGRLLEQLDSRRYERLTAGMTDLLQRGPLRRSPASRMPAPVAAPALVRRRYRRVRKLGDGLGPDSRSEDLHALRIRTKRLRYAVEFLSPLAPKPSQPFIRRLVALQDCLGDHQDALVATRQIREMVDDDLPARAVFLLGRITERYERRIGELRAAFPEAYAGIRGKPWRELRLTLEDGRDDVLATMPPQRVPRLRSAPDPAPARARNPGTGAPAASTPGLTVVGD